MLINYFNVVSVDTSIGTYLYGNNIFHTCWILIFISDTTASRKYDIHLYSKMQQQSTDRASME